MSACACGSFCEVVHSCCAFESACQRCPLAGRPCLCEHIVNERCSNGQSERGGGYKFEAHLTSGKASRRSRRTASKTVPSTSCSVLETLRMVRRECAQGLHSLSSVTGMLAPLRSCREMGNRSLRLRAACERTCDCRKPAAVAGVLRCERVRSKQTVGAARVDGLPANPLAAGHALVRAGLVPVDARKLLEVSSACSPRTPAPD